MTKQKIIHFLVIAFILVSCSPRIQLEPIAIKSFKDRLVEVFPKATITEIETNDHFVKSYQLVLQQPNNHDNLTDGTFEHYIYINHTSYKSPTVLVTEGYNAIPKTYELSKILNANQVQVEYRYYGTSRPDSIPWRFLKNDQAIEDYHSIVSKLKKLYSNKWISTGISKGGETVLIYKSKYPYDVDVAVPYVAPLIDTQEDPRTQEHINSVGTKECRDKISQFQRNVLKNRDSIVPILKSYAQYTNMSFTELSLDEALEYAVLEFPFSFWQWGGNCEEIPVDGENNEMFNYINKIVGFSFYNDQTYYDLLPSYYQHWTELGYYGFDTSNVIDLLKVAKTPTNQRFAPKHIPLTFNPNYIKNVRNYVENQGHKIMYIYGEYDTWYACAPSPKPHVNYLKMVLKGGSHSTRIKDFSNEEKAKIYETLQKWLGYSVTVTPL